MVEIRDLGVWLSLSPYSDNLILYHYSSKGHKVDLMLCCALFCDVLTNLSKLGQ